MARYYFLFCLALIFDNVTVASTIDLAIADSAGSLTFLDEYYPSQVDNSSGAGTLVESPSSNGDAVFFKFSLNTQNTLMTFFSSDLVMQIAETIVVSGEVINGNYSVTDVQYSWDSCSTDHTFDFCDSIIGIYGQSATFSSFEAGFSLTTSATIFLVGYSITEFILLERQFELTQVPVPATIWLLISALAAVPAMRVFSSVQSEIARSRYG